MRGPRDIGNDTLKLTVIITLVLSFCGAVYMFSRADFKSGLIILFVPFVLIYLGSIFKNPLVGLLSVFVANYFVMGIARYIPAPLGLAVDGLLVLTWLSLIFSQFNHKVDWSKAANPLTLVAVIWFSYILFELFNPEAVSRVAWFYAMRGVALYMLLTIPLIFILFDKLKYVDLMLKLWGWFTILAVLKGAQQALIGVDPYEHYWLVTIGGKTHLLPGGLRVFSFFTDAATYGGSMGYSGVVFLILAMKESVRKKKIFYWIVSLTAFYGLAISGTRGAIAVPFAGFALYSVLSRQVKMAVFSVLLVVTVFSILKFTTLGNNVYAIRRFRHGLNSDNESLQVRLENQKRLRVYLANRPFGGGLGSAGNWGQRFAPDSFLANVPTDSWYVMIWAEQGRVGLTLHLAILVFVLGWSSWTIMFRLKDKEVATKMAALASGMFGIMAASYASGALGQMPNGIIVYMSMAFIFMSPRLEKEKSQSDVPAKDSSGTK